MLEERSRKIDLIALALLALNIFLAVALFSYDPADPPATLVYPHQTQTTNACGPLGAFVARTLFNAFGLGGYFALISLSAVTALMLMRRPINEPLLRLTGWLIALLGCTALASMATPGLSPGPVIGPGGYLGAAGRGLLETYFATAGAFILALSLILGGLLLCTDYFLFRMLGWGVGASTSGVGRIVGAGKRRRSSGARR